MKRQTQRDSGLRQAVFEFDNQKRSRRELICRLVITDKETGEAGVSARSVVQVALALEDHIGQRNCVWPSQETLAGITRLSVRTVKRAVGWMKEAGLIVVERQYMGPGRNCLNSYSFMWAAWAGRSNSDQSASYDRPKCQLRQTKVPVTTDQSATTGPLITTEQPPEPPKEQPPAGGLEKFDRGVSEGAPEFSTRRLEAELQLAAATWKQTVSKTDREIIRDMIQEAGGDSMGRDLIRRAVIETNAGIRAGIAKGSPVRQPVSYLERVFHRLTEEAHCR